ncbi:site-specific integrase [Bacillus amyloliquefaciens]|uniref:site-specific integrase n=1 Tax=Bacillus amyloliquefaciens TaxID=1390 RepID=UPI0028077EB0|nr:tyrosine-type recombinase/integrase [Bacillus amyloliquefaciens]MDQ8092286.1 tyrosine-type recombinase/integrase [Bacillus amyloliquefaciens]
MKLNKSKKDNELFYYFNAKKEKRWCYRHRYYDALGKRKEKSKQGFKTENEAYRALLEVKASLLNGEAKQIEYSNLTVSEWLDIWYETHLNDWKISTQVQRSNAIKYQMKPLLGKYKLAQLDKTTYKRVFINELLKTYKPKSVELFHRLFKAAVNAAVDDEIIPRNRFTRITIPGVKDSADNFLTASELNRFLSVAERIENITNYSLILLLSYTGMRKGEALGLKWGDLNLNDKTIKIERTRDTRGVRSPKTKNSYRTIPVDDLLIDQLKTYKFWCKQTLLGFGKHISDDDFIFIDEKTTGQPVKYHILKHNIDKLTKKAECNPITLNGLRHTHATILIGRRIPVKVIAKRLGNTPQMILNIYGHSFKDLEEEAVEAFGEALKAAAGGGFGGGF